MSRQNAVHSNGRPRRRDNHPSAALAKAHGIKIRDPRDYVVIIGNRIIDGDRSFSLEQTIPAKLEAGAALEYRPPDRDAVNVTVVSDYGEEVEVDFDDGKTPRLVVSRARLFGRLPVGRPRLVHKTKLAALYGAKFGALFWDAVLRMRVPPVHKAKRQRSESDSKV